MVKPSETTDIIIKRLLELQKSHFEQTVLLINNTERFISNSEQSHELAMSCQKLISLLINILYPTLKTMDVNIETHVLLSIKRLLDKNKKYYDAPQHFGIMENN